MIEEGFCHCGCGGRTSFAKKSSHAFGHVKGRPMSFILGHNGYLKSKTKYFVDELTGCWNWYSVGHKGYGIYRREAAHRYIYKKMIGLIPEGLELDHICRNRRCVNPNHLRPVTGKENVQCGSNAKLIPDQVKWMREKHKEGWTYKQLAGEFGINPSTAHKAVVGQSWGNVC